MVYGNADDDDICLCAMEVISQYRHAMPVNWFGFVVFHCFESRLESLALASDKGPTPLHPLSSLKEPIVMGNRKNPSPLLSWFRWIHVVKLLIMMIVCGNCGRIRSSCSDS